MQAEARAPSLSRGFALLLCYSLATLFLGISLAWATFFELYPRSGTLIRALVPAVFFTLVITLGWVAIPLNRPRLGAIALKVVMVWSLVTVAGIVRVHLHGGALRSAEWVVLCTTATIFVLAIYVARHSRWGRKRLNRR